MSRDELGAAAWSRAAAPAGRASSAPALPPGPHGSGLHHDDLDGPPTGTPTGRPAGDRAADDGPAGDGPAGGPGARPGRGRRVAALLLAAALGAGGTLLAVRGSDAGGSSLVALSLYPDSYSGSWGESGGMSLVMAVGNTGQQDLVVLGGGTRTAAGDAVGELAPTGYGRVADRAGEDGVARLPAGSTALVQLTVDGSCDEPPPWDPWLRVRTPSGDTAEVAVAVLDDPDGPGLTGIEEACSYSFDGQPFTPSVVGQRSDGEGLVLQVRNDTASAYGVEVLSGGVAGLELVDPGVALEPSSTTDVAVRVAPSSCEAAVGAPDLVHDVALQATRAGDGEGPSSVRLDLNPYGAGGAVGIGVGRACAAGA